jgi:outer membrane lipase/esterase
MIGAGVGNTIQTIQTLWTAGARHILVPNIPDLGLTPYALASGFGPLITQLSAAYNQALGGALAALQSAGVAAIPVDAFGTLQAMVNESSTFGFENVTQPYLSMFTEDVDTFLFWDAVHPTTRGQEVLGAVAVAAVIDHFHPRKGKGLPEAQVNALNGLVRTSHAD